MGRKLQEFSISKVQKSVEMRRLTSLTSRQPASKTLTI